MRVRAIVPVKCHARAKTRLAPVLVKEERMKLARAFASHVLGVLEQSEFVEGVLVSTDCPEIESFARSRGADVLRDASADASLGVLIDDAIDTVAARGATGAIVLMSDLPLLSALDVERLELALRRTPLVIAPDRHEEGTNALAMMFAHRMPTCFGNQGSFDLHRERARALGVPYDVVRSRGFACDVDAPDDLAVVRQDGARGSWKRNFESRVSAA
jgi:2-phospho-L-lactate guanylyltransferase